MVTHSIFNITAPLFVTISGSPVTWHCAASDIRSESPQISEEAANTMKWITDKGVIL
jgi:hypothetical protein